MAAETSVAQLEKKQGLKTRLYIVLIERGVARQRFFLEGEDSDDARLQLGTVLRGLPALASSCGTWLEFREAAINAVAKVGFRRVAH